MGIDGVSENLRKRFQRIHNAVRDYYYADDLYDREFLETRRQPYFLNPLVMPILIIFE